MTQATRKYFGTDGIRGKVGESLINPEFVLKLGWAAGVILGNHHAGKVLIGKDTRISGYMLESALEAGFSAAVMGSLVGVLAGFCAAGPIGAAGGGVGGAIAGELVGRTINHRWLAHKEENERVHQILTVPARNQSSVDHWAASVSSFFAPKLEQERAKAAEILEKKRQEALSISQPQKNAGKEKKRSLWQRILNQAADTKDPEEKSLHGKKHVTFSNEVVVPEGNDSVPGYSAHR